MYAVVLSTAGTKYFLHKTSSGKVAQSLFALIENRIDTVSNIIQHVDASISVSLIRPDENLIPWPKRVELMQKVVAEEMKLRFETVIEGELV